MNFNKSSSSDGISTEIESNSYDSENYRMKYVVAVDGSSSSLSAVEQTLKFVSPVDAIYLLSTIKPIHKNPKTNKWFIIKKKDEKLESEIIETPKLENTVLETETKNETNAEEGRVHFEIHTPHENWVSSTDKNGNNIHRIHVHNEDLRNNLKKQHSLYNPSKPNKWLDEAEKLVLEAGIKNVSKHLVISDNIGEGILTFAKDENCDMILMGSRGRGLIKGLLMGSVSMYVLQNSIIPVTICNTKTNKR